MLFNLTKAEIASARPFIEKYIEHLLKIYKPSSLYDAVPTEMTKKVVTFDLINRQVKELEDLLKGPTREENKEHGNIIRHQFKQRDHLSRH